jgi:hypothetical protein
MSWKVINCFFDSTNDSTECYMRKDNIKLLATNDYFFAIPDFNTVLDSLLKIQKGQVIDAWDFKITSMNLFNGHTLNLDENNIIITLGSLKIIFDDAKSGPHFIWKDIAIPNVAGLKPYIERFDKLKAFV